MLRCTWKLVVTIATSKTTCPHLLLPSVTVVTVLGSDLCFFTLYFNKIFDKFNYIQGFVSNFAMFLYIFFNRYHN